MEFLSNALSAIDFLKVGAINAETNTNTFAINMKLAVNIILNIRLERLQGAILRQGIWLRSLVRYAGKRQRSKRIMMTILNQWIFAGYAKSITMNGMIALSSALCMKSLKNF